MGNRPEIKNFTSAIEKGRRGMGSVFKDNLPLIDWEFRAYMQHLKDMDDFVKSELQPFRIDDVNDESLLRLGIDFTTNKPIKISFIGGSFEFDLPADKTTLPDNEK